MPVLLEKIESPGDQDLIDLERIYQDFPEKNSWRAVKEGIEQEDFQCYAGRFNDRLLGAFCLSKKNGMFYLKYLCVRKITRNRHVAKEMLRQLLQDIKTDLFVEDSHPSEALSNVLVGFGFTKTEAGAAWVWRLNKSTVDAIMEK